MRRAPVFILALALGYLSNAAAEVHTTTVDYVFDHTPELEARINADVLGAGGHFYVDDEFLVSLNITNNRERETPVDIHYGWISPGGTVYEMPDYNTQFTPWLSGVPLPARMAISAGPGDAGIPMNYTLPPAESVSGAWRSFIALTTPGTLEILALGTQEFNIESAAGTDSPLAGDGVSGAVDGTVHTLDGMTLVTEANGYIAISGRADDQTRVWNLQFPLEDGTHACDRYITFIQFQKDLLDSASRLSLGTGDAGTRGALSQCAITVTSVSDTAVEGTFTATMIDEHDTAYSITDGHFHATR